MGVGINVGLGGNPVFFMRSGPGANPASMSGMNGAAPDLNGIQDMLGNIFRNFQDLFSGHEFLRMNTIYQGFSPDTFMNNFQHNYFSDQDFLEMARRMSE